MFAARHQLEFHKDHLDWAVRDFIRARGQPRVLIVAPDKVDEELRVFAAKHGLKVVPAPVGEGWVLSNLEDAVLHDPAADVSIVQMAAAITEENRHDEIVAAAPVAADDLAVVVDPFSHHVAAPEPEPEPEPEPAPVLPAVAVELDPDVEQSPFVAALK